MADITLARVVGDWRRIVGDRVTSHETAGFGFGVTGTVTLIPHLGDKSQGVPGAPNALYTAERLECKVLWGLLHDAGHNNQWQDVAVAVDGSRIVWEARFDLEYKDRPDRPAQKLELLPARFGPEQVVDGQVNVAALSGALVEYPPAVVGLAQAASADAIAAAERAESAADDVDSAIAGAADQVVQAVESDRVAAEAAAAAASGSASAAGVSAGDASAAAGAAAQSASGADGSAAGAASSAGAAAQSAADAEGSASDAAGAVVDARAARDAAEGHASSAAGSALAAAGSVAAADGHAGRAETAANSFGLSATSSTLAPGSPATVNVTGDGPAYSLVFGVPQGAKGDTGAPGEVSQDELASAISAAITHISGVAPESLDTIEELSAALLNNPDIITEILEAVGKRALIDGAPAAYNTLGKLVAALQNHELGGSTDASLLTGALTSQVDASGAVVILDLSSVGGPSALQMPLSSFGAIYSLALQNEAALEDKSDVGHKHPVSDLTATGTASSTTFLRGDGSWATPPNTTYSVPTQAEAEAGTATTARAFSAQRVAQGAIAASGKKDWQGTQAQYDALPTKDADRTYWIV